MRNRGIVMNKMLFSFAICFIALAGCQAGQDNTSSTSEVLEEAIGIEQTNANQENDDIAEVVIDQHNYDYSFSDYPILSRYLGNFNKPVQKLQSLSFTHVINDQYIVTFACHQDDCSYLLIDFDQASSFLLSDLSVLTEYQLSPDQSFAAFLFERSTEDQTPTHHLSVLNLETLQPVELELQEEEQLIPRPNQFQYPIRSVTFDTNQIITVESEPISNSGVRDVITTHWIYQ
ncbi:hypothetical protein [Halobacillus salinus]|uniref:hypothetical protein n=1 Tax=Halobacillus salinus TaxID=192814 RepID=UPI00159081DD|nr:hypothetical protein [Halobacillus salinus]